MNTNERTPMNDTNVNTNGNAKAHDGMDAGRAARIGMIALAVGFGGFLLWAGFAPLDEGVPAQALVSIDTKRKPVQHLSGGILKEVLVREGDVVKDEQVVARLEPAVTKANYEASRQRYFGLRAIEGRLLAEQGGGTRISWHPDLQEGGKDPQIRAQMQTQEQLLQARQAALAADLAAINESIRAQQSQIETLRGMLELRKQQFNLLSEQLKNIRGLVAEGYAPRNQQLDLERAVAESMAAQTDLQGGMVRAQSAISELRQRAIARQQEYRKEVETQRADVTREVQAEAEKYAALQLDLQRVDIKATAAGQVVGLAVQASGSVISPGFKLMDIVPKDEALLLEAKIPPHVIDRVRAGLPVDIRFSTFSHTPTLVVDGEVVSVSGDMLTEPQTNAMYYLARVKVTAEGLKKLGARQMQPGMPAEVVVRTGERSMLTYLLSPLVRRVAASMKEE
ncbi:MAG: HlyD family type I secretion periplasmic adaptor subunit [Burkholderiaceae bacterium]